MKKLILRSLALVWNDEAAARALIRGAVHALGLGGVAFADQLAQLVHAPGMVTAIKVASLTAAFVGGNIIGGQTNPEPKP
jgi:hypothetical protein